MERVKDRRQVGNRLLLNFCYRCVELMEAKTCSNSVKRMLYSCLRSALQQPQNRCKGKCVLYT
jgi:hypothetical protein